MTQKSRDQKEADPNITSFAAGVIVFAAVFSFFASPLLRFADLSMLASLGSLMGVLAAVVWIAVKNDAEPKWATTACVVIAGIVFLLIVWVLNVAIATASSNSVRCAALQTDMLSVKPRRSDSAALFQALGCVPKGAEQVHFPTAEAAN